MDRSAKNRIQPPPASGARLNWEQVPARVRTGIEALLGSPVVTAVTQPGGFSPGAACRLKLKDGRRAFVKAIGPEPNPSSPAFHRREAVISRAMPPGVPVPRFIGSHDEGEGGWVALAFEDIEGRSPRQPWDADELDRVVRACVRLSDALTPSPLPAGTAREASRLFADSICGWRRLAAAPHDGLDSWSARNLQRLARLEEEAPAAVQGNTLIHMDIRADNVLLTGRRVYFVDWPHAAVGAAWVDLVAFAPSVAMQGGPDPEDLLSTHGAARAADRDAVTAAIAALAGFFTAQSLLPPPPGLPGLRAFQAAQGIEARKWVAARTGWK